MPKAKLREKERYDARPAIEASGLTIVAFAEHMGVPAATIHRWIRDGVNAERADRLAVKGAGMHPSLIWPEWNGHWNSPEAGDNT